MTATITHLGVQFELPELSILFDRASRCMVVEGRGESSEASTVTSYPFSLIETIKVGCVSDSVSKLVVIFANQTSLMLCRVERELASRLAWVLGDLTRAMVDLESADSAPLGPPSDFDTMEDPTRPVELALVERLVDRRGPDTQELSREELLPVEDDLPEVDPDDIIELSSVVPPRAPSSRTPRPRMGTPRARHMPEPARPRRASVRDTAPDMRALPREGSDSGGSGIGS